LAARRKWGMCLFNGCQKRGICRGLCGGHYTQLKRGTPLRPIRPYVMCGQTYKVCTFHQCGKRHLSHGLCTGHYRQKQKGYPLKELGPDRKRGERVTYTCKVSSCGEPHRRSGLCALHSWLKSRYSMNPADYERALEEQQGRCAICRSKCDAYSRLSVDHDHDTGRFRGLLCNKCNHGLGRFRDRPDLLRAAAIYLELAAERIDAPVLVAPAWATPRNKVA
jgi:hypothetical protein